MSQQDLHNLSSFYSVNYLEESMSFIERTAKKLYPILVEVKKKMVKEKSENSREGLKSKRKKVETLDVDDMDGSMIDEGDYEDILSLSSQTN